MNKVNALLLLSLLVSVSVVSIGIVSMRVCSVEPKNTPHRLSSLVPHDPISVSGNAAFAAQGWPGNGSQQSPYVIEGLEIVAGITCISIRNSNAYFIIRNCMLVQTDTEASSIWLSHVSNGAVENCSISSGRAGVVLVATTGCAIVNSTLTDCGYYGILQSGSNDNCTLSGNRVIHCGGYGFRLSYMKYSLVENNCILDCGEMGIGFQYSQNVTVANNEVSNGGRFGLYIASTGNCTFINNTLQDGGVGIGGEKQYWIHSFYGNVVNGRPFGYFLRTNNTEVDGSQYGQLFLIDCFNVSLSSGVFSNVSVGPSLLSCVNCTISDMEIRENLYGINLLESENITLRNNTLIDCGIRFDGADTRHWAITETANTVNGKPFGYFLNQDDFSVNGNDYGQLVLVSSDDFSIANGTFDSVTVGMGIHSCSNCSVRNARFVADYYLGLEIVRSSNCTLTNVTIEDCRNGGLNIDTCHNATVIESRIQRNGFGIWVFTSDYCIIGGNQIYENQGFPIYFCNTSYGMVKSNVLYDNADSLELYVVNWLEIVNNTIFGSSSDGLYLDFTSGVIIRDNRVYGNAEYGLSLGAFSLFSEIYNNIIGFNSAGNAQDAGFYNYWDDGESIGNVWSDYSGTGDYSISGMGVDHYPRSFLTRPADFWYWVGTSVPPVTWDVRLPDPDSYVILWDGAIVAQGSLNSSLEHLSRSITGLPAGIYSLTLVVNDGSGHSLTDTVIITVIERATTTTTVTTTTTTSGTSSATTSTTAPSDMTIILFVAAGGVVGAVVIVLIFVIRKKDVPV